MEGIYRWISAVGDGGDCDVGYGWCDVFEKMRIDVYGAMILQS